MEGLHHESVLLDEVIELLALRPGARAVDVTTGLAGHAAAILARTGPDGTLLAIDRDPVALAHARAVLAPYGDRVRFHQGPFSSVVEALAGERVDALVDLEKDLADYATKARESRIKLEDLEGGVFTITNGGIFGSLLSTPIINPPQSAILGVHAIQDRPVALNGQVVIRPMMYLALSYDHRIVDGREAVTFLVKVKQAIEDPARLLLGV